MTTGPPLDRTPAVTHHSRHLATDGAFDPRLALASSAGVGYSGLMVNDVNNEKSQRSVV
jgi:hypothetical protein